MLIQFFKINPNLTRSWSHVSYQNIPLPVDFLGRKWVAWLSKPELKSRLFLISAGICSFRKGLNSPVESRKLLLSQPFCLSLEIYKNTKELLSFPSIIGSQIPSTGRTLRKPAYSLSINSSHHTVTKSHQFHPPAVSQIHLSNFVPAFIPPVKPSSFLLPRLLQWCPNLQDSSSPPPTWQSKSL